MIRILISSFLTFLVVFDANSQSSEYGVGLGASVYWGDMNSESITGSAEHAHPAFQAFARYNLSNRLNFKSSLAVGKLSGDDAKSTDELRQQRNLNFHSSLIELAFLAEFNLFKYNPNSSRIAFTPYFTGGFAFFHFNPKTTYNGETIALQPLGTEGQGVPGDSKNKYKRIALAIPIGGGLKMSFGNGWTIGGSLIGRLTTTDYIDDLSTDYADYNFLLRYNGEMAAYLSDRRDEYFGLNEGSFNDPSKVRGGPDVKDYYITMMVTVGKVLKGNIFSLRSKSACPTAF